MLIKDISNARYGDHFSFIYKNDEQLFSIVIPFLIKGLENNERCIYVSDKTPKEKILFELSKKEKDIKKFIKSRQFIILNSKETYLKNGSFDPDAMIGILRETEKLALREGYAGVRGIGESSWINKGIKGSERLIEYESKLHNFFLDSKFCVICLYDERIISPEILAESIHCHPEIIFYGKVCENLYYSANLFATENSKSLPSGAYELIKEDFVGRDI